MDGKSHASLLSVDFSSMDKPVHAAVSSIADELYPPDSPGYANRKRNQLTPSPSGRQSTAIQRAQQDKIIKDLRRKEVFLNLNNI